MPNSAATRLHLPRPALAHCLLAGVIRDTRGQTLSAKQRFNYYPSTPMSSLSWVFEGSAHLVMDQGVDGQPVLGPPLPRMSISGPRRNPTISWNPGPVYAMILPFYPEALARLLGIDLQELSGPTRAIEDVVSSQFRSACQSIFESADNDPFRHVEDMLEPLWTGQRSTERKSLVLMTDWIRSQMTRAAHSKPGRSARQLQRLVRNWTGQSHRDLQMFARVEKAYLCRADNQTEKGIDLAGIAADAGYADQSHMGREIRRLTGFSPKRLDRMMISEEPFWLYRLFSEQFGS